MMEKFKWFPRVKEMIDESFGNPSISSLKQVMFLLLRNVSCSVDNCIRKRKTRRAKLLHETLRSLMLHFHICYKNRLKHNQDTEKPTFYDAMAALASLTLDLQVYIAVSNPTRSSEYVSQAVRDILLYLGPQPNYIWDVAIQSSMLRDTEVHKLTAPIFGRLMESAPKVTRNPEHFTKFLLASWCWMTSEPRESEQKVIRSHVLQMTPPEDFNRWFLSLPIQGIQNIQASMSTRKLLKLLFHKKFMKDIFRELCEILSEDMPVVCEESSTCFRISPGKESESNLFVIDKRGKASDNEIDVDNEDDDEPPLQVQLGKAIETLPSMHVPEKFAEDSNQALSHPLNNENESSSTIPKKPHKRNLELMSEESPSFYSSSPTKQARATFPSVNQQTDSLMFQSTNVSKNADQHQHTHVEDKERTGNENTTFLGATHSKNQSGQTNESPIPDEPSRKVHKPTASPSQNVFLTKSLEVSKNMSDKSYESDNSLPRWLQKNATTVDDDDSGDEVGEKRVEIDAEMSDASSEINQDTNKACSEESDDELPVDTDSFVDNHEPHQQYSHVFKCSDKLHKGECNVIDDVCSSNLENSLNCMSGDQESGKEIENEKEEGEIEKLGRTGSINAGETPCDDDDDVTDCSLKGANDIGRSADQLLYSPMSQRTSSEQVAKHTSNVCMSPLRIFSSSESSTLSPVSQSSQLRVFQTRSSPRKQLHEKEPFLTKMSPKLGSPEKPQPNSISLSKTPPTNLNCSTTVSNKTSPTSIMPSALSSTNDPTSSVLHRYSTRSSPKKSPSQIISNFSESSPHPINLSSNKTSGEETNAAEGILLPKQSSPGKLSSPQKIVPLQGSSPSKSVKKSSFKSIPSNSPEDFPHQINLFPVKTTGEETITLLGTLSTKGASPKGSPHKSLSPTKSCSVTLLKVNDIPEAGSPSRNIPPRKVRKVVDDNSSSALYDEEGCVVYFNDKLKRSTLTGGDNQVPEVEHIISANERTTTQDGMTPQNSIADDKNVGKTPMILRSRRQLPLFQSEVKEFHEDRRQTSISSPKKANVVQPGEKGYNLRTRSSKKR